MARMESPLGQVYGLGSARGGTQDFWRSRLTSIALVPLSIWWILGVITHVGADYPAFTAWLRQPMTAILMILSLAVMFYHIALGLQVVLEDYVHNEGIKLGSVIAVKFACVFFAVAGIFAVLRIAFGG